jgi:hypothetical protein
VATQPAVAQQGVALHLETYVMVELTAVVEQVEKRKVLGPASQLPH